MLKLCDTINNEYIKIELALHLLHDETFSIIQQIILAEMMKESRTVRDAISSYC